MASSDRKKRNAKSDPRDLVLTVCPIKASGQAPPPLSGHTCSLLSGQPRLFLFGGANEEKLFGDAYLFDMGQLTWSRCDLKGFYPPPLFGHTATVVNQHVYIFGGITYSTTYKFEADGKSEKNPLDGRKSPNGYFSPLRSSMMIATKSDKDKKSALSFKSKARNPSPYRQEASNALFSLHMEKLVWEEPSEIISTSETPIEEKKSEKDSVDTDRSGEEHGGGGDSPSSSQPTTSATSSTTLSKASSSLEEEEACLAPALYMHSACAVGTLIVIFGGCMEPDFKASTDVLHVYDTVRRKWFRPRTTGAAPSPRHGHSSCHVGHGKILIFGGANQDIQPSSKTSSISSFSSSTPSNSPENMITRFNDLFLLDANTWTWSQPEVNGSPPLPRAFHNAGLVASKDSVSANLSLDISNLSSSLTPPAPSSSLAPTETSSPTSKGGAPSEPTFGGGTRSPTPGGSSSGGSSRGGSPTDLLVDKNQLLYIFAGETHAASSELCVLNLSTWTWGRPLFDGSFEHEMHASVVISDKLLVFGGLSRTSGILDDFFFINTVSIRSGVTKNDYTFKLVIVGDSSVGKSCLMTRFVEDRYSDIHLSTIGIDFKTVTTMLEGKIVKLHIWDTAGQERFAQVTTHYYRGADGAIVVYDVSNKKSFENVESWVSAVVSANPDGGVNLLLVGNKNDLNSERQVTRAQGQELAAKLGAPFIETSAKDACNVDVMFLNLAKKLVKNRRALVGKDGLEGSGKNGRRLSMDGIGRIKLDSQTNTPTSTSFCCK